MAGGQSVAVYGAGSWGTALAIHLARNGNRVTLWGRDPARQAELRARGENARYLPGIPFPPGLTPVDELAAAVAAADLHLVVVPSEGFRAMLTALRPLLPAGAGLVWATKGIETGSGKLLHEVVGEVFGPDWPYALVSGPTFAREVALGMPTAMAAAANRPALLERLIAAFHGGSMRIYRNDDIVGIELGGAVKNVLAIAAGIADGLGFGANARAALITRGLAEITRLAEALGARRETLMGLAGLGDLVLTCTDDQSRNRRFGLLLGQGHDQQTALQRIGQVVEGMVTASVILSVAERAGVEMPICAEVNKVLYEGLPPQQAVSDLLARRQRAEF